MYKWDRLFIVVTYTENTSSKNYFILYYMYFQKELENIEFAEEELMMLDGEDAIPYPLSSYYSCWFVYMI